MDYIIKKASALTAEEQEIRGIVGIPQDWPIEKYEYQGSVPEGFEQITEEDLATLITNNQASYDAWLQSLRPVVTPLPPAPTEVVTQFEKRDKTLKIACGSAAVDSETGEAVILLKIPGTPGSGDGRWILGGVAFFDQAHAGDKIEGVYFTDEDNLLGAGAGTLVGSYTDDDAGSNKGWFIPVHKGEIKAEAIGGYGYAPSGFYIKIVGKKAAGQYSGNLYVNFEWGREEA